MNLINTETRLLRLGEKKQRNCFSGMNKISKKSFHISATRGSPYQRTSFVHFVYRVCLGWNVEGWINSPSLSTTKDRGSWGEAKTEPWSIHPFISRIPPPPPSFHWPTPSQSAPAETGEAAMQVIRATTVMATNHWGNCCSNRLCSMLSAILSTISFINGTWCHGSDYTPVTSDSHMCLYVNGENKSICFKHATCSAPG